MFRSINGVIQIFLDLHLVDAFLGVDANRNLIGSTKQKYESKLDRLDETKIRIET
jgi:hypothetical protein